MYVYIYVLCMNLYVYVCICIYRYVYKWSKGSAGPGLPSESESEAAAGEGCSSRSIWRGLRAPFESVSESVIPGSRPPRLRFSARPAARAPPPAQPLGMGGPCNTWMISLFELGAGVRRDAS
jgi:hypothetical protein